MQARSEGSPPPPDEHWWAAVLREGEPEAERPAAPPRPLGAFGTGRAGGARRLGLSLRSVEQPEQSRI